MMQKERQSNIELLRIVAMLMVMIVHANYWRIGTPTIADAAVAPMSTFTRILVQHLASPCVDVFIIISGYFAIRPKLKSLSNLWFLLAYWGGVSVMVDGGTLSSCLYRIFLPFLGWFIPAYLGLYLISPILNQYSEHEEGNRFRTYLIVFFVLQFVFDLICKRWSIFGRPIFNNGYSILSFVPLYLMGRYLRLHRPLWLKRSFKFWFLLYGGIFFLSSVSICALLYFSTPFPVFTKIANYVTGFVNCYTSPVTIVGSIFLFLAFESVQFSSKLVNRVAASVLGAFCFHSMGFYAPVVCGIYRKFSGIQVLLLDGAFILAVFAVATIVDQVRILIWEKGSKYVFKS